jgi:hypothetical protein
MNHNYFFHGFVGGKIANLFHLRLHGSDPQFRHGVEFEGVLLPPMSGSFGNVNLYDDVIGRFMRFNASEKRAIHVGPHDPSKLNDEQNVDRVKTRATPKSL